MGLVDSLMRVIEDRVTIESPSVPLTSKNLSGMFGSTLSTAGVEVTNTTVLGYPAVWRAVNLISRDVAKLPLMVYKRMATTGKERAIRHPAYRLLRKKPNQEMTAFIFKQTLQANALLHRGGFACIIRDGAASPVELRWLDPTRTYPVREAGTLMYVTSIPAVGADGREYFIDRKLPANDVLHIRGLGYDGLNAYSAVEVLREALGIGMAAQKFGSVFFRNAARPSVVIELPGYMKDEQAIKRFREGWESMQSGLDNTARTALLENGAKISQWSMNNNDAQFLETRQFEAKQVANIFFLSPHKVGDDARTSYASLEQENQSHLDDAIDPWLVCWEEELEDKLLTEEQKRKDSHIIEFNRDALIRTDLATTVNTLIAEVNNGLMVTDEARAIRNRPPLPNGLGQKVRRPANIVIEGEEEEEPPVDEVPAETPMDVPQEPEQLPAEASEGERVAQALAGLMSHEIRKMITSLANQAMPKAGTADFKKWRADFKVKNYDRIRATFEAAFPDRAQLITDRLFLAVSDSVQHDATPDQVQQSFNILVRDAPEHLTRWILETK